MARRRSAPRAVGGSVGDRALFRDAALRVLHAADAIGIRRILARADSNDAEAFHRAQGLEPSLLDPMSPMAALTGVRKNLA